MKKSEKVEVRLSLAEKESLARLSDAQGQSASEIVRDLLNAQIASVDAKSKETNMLSKSKLAYAIVGLILGGLCVLGWVKFHNPLDTFKMVVRIKDDMGRYEVGSVVPVSGVDATQARLPIDATHAYIVTSSVKKDRKGQLKASFDICLSDGEVCAPIADPSFLLSKTEFSSSEFRTSDNREIEISLFPIQ